MIRRDHRLADGRTLSWLEKGDGPPLVLLHGWSLSAAAFTELARLLAGWRLLLPDLPGHGQSTPPVDVSLPSLADDIAAWLAAVAPEPVLLGGWSLGGMVAMELAAKAETPVNRLLLMATTPRFTSDSTWPHGLPAIQVRALRRNLDRRFEATLGEFFALTFADGEVDAERLRTIRAFAVRPGGLPDRQASAAFLQLLAEQDQRPLVAKIGCPTLVVHGTLDRITPVAAGRALAAALPRGRFYELTGAGHAPFWTRPPDVAQAIREFCTWDR
ncbi:MAG: alpha/beta fold hydrolase [Desulfuromonadales bacterium]|nr:alpha/beta fold hydrolase [Desulfuromonadales bacterium]